MDAERVAIDDLALTQEHASDRSHRSCSGQWRPAVEANSPLPRHGKHRHRAVATCSNQSDFQQAVSVGIDPQSHFFDPAGELMHETKPSQAEAALEVDSASRRYRRHNTAGST